MSLPETELEMARRHVAEGEAMLQRQREALMSLQGYGDDADSKASSLLLTLEASQAVHRKHLEKLEREAATLPGSQQHA